MFQIRMNPDSMESLDPDPEKQIKIKEKKVLDVIFGELGAVLRIWDVYPGSEFFHRGSRIRIIYPGSRVKKDSGSASKNLSIFNPKMFLSSQI